MSFVNINVGTETYPIPKNGTNPSWGEQLTDAIVAISEGLATAQGPNDIQETSANILNTSGAKDISGLAFNNAQVRSVEVSYNISRKITKTLNNIPTGTGVIQLTTATTHDLFTGDQITLASTDSTPAINGAYTITVVDSTNFTIDIGATTITVAGATGTFQIEHLESGIMLCNYGQQGWNLSQERVGDASVIIDIGSTGQFTYNPTVMTGTVYQGVIKFIAKALITT